jgi:peroxiredoxin
MTLHAYSIVMPIVGILALVSLLVGIVYFVMALVGWRGPDRNRRLMRSLIFASAYPIAFVLVQVLIHRLVLPTIAREQQPARQQRADVASIVKRGDKTPSFRIRTTDGDEFAIDRLRGKVVLVSFFATWCGPCLLERPEIEKIFQAHREHEDFALLVIGREETDAKVAEFKAARKFSFPIAADSDRSVYGLFAKELIPRTYLIAKDGTVCFTSTGYSGEDMIALQSAIAAQLAARTSARYDTSPAR